MQLPSSLNEKLNLDFKTTCRLVSVGKGEGGLRPERLGVHPTVSEIKINTDALSTPLNCIRCPGEGNTPQIKSFAK
jgi:hypothetical protein